MAAATELPAPSSLGRATTKTDLVCGRAWVALAPPGVSSDISSSITAKTQASFASQTDLFNSLLVAKA